MNLKDWNQAQVKEALGDTNRYYFWLKYGRNGTDQELLLYYASAGGARDFARNHEKDKPKGKK